MKIIEPHIHMLARTTDDYQRMYANGIRACVEPSFWQGVNRRYAGTFFDYFQLSLEFESIRSRRFGIDHFSAIALNPKETDDLGLAREVVAGMDEYLDHERCVAMGEIGFNEITDNEEIILREQLAIAQEKEMVVIVHLPHFNKPEGVKRLLKVLEDFTIPREKILIDHNTEETLPQLYGSGYYLGMTVYPISKLTPERVSSMIREYGSEKVFVSGSADWGISDPLSLIKVVDYMKQDGHPKETIEKLVFNTPMEFYSQSPRWKPELDLEPVDPEVFQR